MPTHIRRQHHRIGLRAHGEIADDSLNPRFLQQTGDHFCPRPGDAGSTELDKIVGKQRSQRRSAATRVGGEKEGFEFEKLVMNVQKGSPLELHRKASMEKRTQSLRRLSRFTGLKVKPDPEMRSVMEEDALNVSSKRLKPTATSKHRSCRVRPMSVADQA